MTKEQKQLLLTDLCARLPYGVKAQNSVNGEVIDLKTRMYCLPTALATNFKPYLRMMSSMTEEEKVELVEISKEEYKEICEGLKNGGDCISEGRYKFHYSKEVDWLNSHHFDYRGLIPIGLALEDYIWAGDECSGSDAWNFNATYGILIDYGKTGTNGVRGSLTFKRS